MPAAIINIRFANIGESTHAYAAWEVARISAQADGSTNPYAESSYVWPHVEAGTLERLWEKIGLSFRNYQLVLPDAAADPKAGWQMGEGEEYSAFASRHCACLCIGLLLAINLPCSVQPAELADLLNSDTMLGKDIGVDTTSQELPLDAQLSLMARCYGEQHSAAFMNA